MMKRQTNGPKLYYLSCTYKSSDVLSVAELSCTILPMCLDREMIKYVTGLINSLLNAKSCPRLVRLSWKI